MTNNPNFYVKLERVLAAEEVQSIIRGFIESGFQPSMGVGVFYTDSDTDNTIELDRHWGPTARLQKVLVEQNTTGYELGLSIRLHNDAMAISLGFEKDRILVYQQDALPKVGHTPFADINPLIVATYDSLVRSLGPIELEATFSAD